MEGVQEQIGLIGVVMFGQSEYEDNVSFDDFSFDILIDDSGVCLLFECGGDCFLDEEFSVVDEIQVQCQSVGCDCGECVECECELVF